jgi:hypothetical protein
VRRKLTSDETVEACEVWNSVEMYLLGQFGDRRRLIDRCVQCFLPFTRLVGEARGRGENTVDV